MKKKEISLSKARELDQFKYTVMQESLDWAIYYLMESTHEYVHDDNDNRCLICSGEKEYPMHVVGDFMKYYQSAIQQNAIEKWIEDEAICLLRDECICECGGKGKDVLDENNKSTRDENDSIACKCSVCDAIIIREWDQ